MADRAGSEGDPGVPKEVFELDKDERWQARLEEARARREIALREKAAGKPSKPRPKPWEIEGSEVEEPPAIEPIVQERGDDKFDFADRLESIRDGKNGAAEPAPVPEQPEKTTAPRERAMPEFRPAPRSPVPAARKSGLEPRARPQPSLILPGAPDVAELAERYAATLTVVDDPEPGPAEVESDTAQSTPDTTLVPLSGIAPQPATDDRPKRTRAERRRGIRPLGMALALAGLAALPFATEAPPLETGPSMPPIDGFRFQPALGVTWSLNNRPVETRPGEWQPSTPPSALATVPFARSASLDDSIEALQVPASAGSSELEWTGMEPVFTSASTALFVPERAAENLPEVAGAPEARASDNEIAPEPAPRETATEVMTAPPVEPEDDVGNAVAPVNTAPVSAPPGPEAVRGEDAAAPPLPPARSQSVLETDPLRVTILAPLQADRKMAQDIATDLQRDGHELVRVQDVEYSINERNLRYFHDQDRSAAARMAERYDAELRDFTWFRPKPLEGTAELWLSGRAPAGAGGPRDQGTTARTVDPAAILGRVFDRLGLSTELPENLPGGEN